MFLSLERSCPGLGSGLLGLRGSCATGLKVCVCGVGSGEVVLQSFSELPLSKAYWVQILRAGHQAHSPGSGELAGE